MFFKRSFAKQVPEDMNALQERPGKYIKADERLKKETYEVDNECGKKRRSDQGYNIWNKYTKNDKFEDSASMIKNEPKFTEYARINTARSQILMESENDKDVKWPKPPRMKGERKNQHLYCRFHKDNGHNMDGYRH